VAEDIGPPMVGQMGVAGSINIVFEADLSRYVAHRPSILYWVPQTGAEVGGIGMGLVRCVRPWHEWLVVWGYDINGSTPDLTARRRPRARSAVCRCTPLAISLQSGLPREMKGRVW
jgi:2,4-dichlorophenol 6-monooxygenase